MFEGAEEGGEAQWREQMWGEVVEGRKGEVL
jgi:hypothetical protein